MHTKIPYIASHPLEDMWWEVWQTGAGGIAAWHTKKHTGQGAVLPQSTQAPTGQRAPSLPSSSDRVNNSGSMVLTCVSKGVPLPHLCRNTVHALCHDHGREAAQWPRNTG